MNTKQARVSLTACSQNAVSALLLRSITGGFLLSYTSLTSLDDTLTVRDTVTGAARTYDSAGNFCGSVHSNAFAN
jgi:hypothetical protein